MFLTVRLNYREMTRMTKERITVKIRNEDETERALGRFVQCCEEVELWSESQSGRHFLAVFGGAYVVFEKSPDDGVHDKPYCKYVGSTPIGPEEEECFADDFIWREHGGCVTILFRDMYDYSRRPSERVVFDDYAYEFSERKFRTKNNAPEFLKRKKLVRSYLGKTVDIRMDRPLGYVHEKEKYTLTYPINYGYIPGVIGGDGEELDVYLLGVDEPVSEYTAKIIGIVHRENDCEDKLVAAPEGTDFSKEEIADKVSFQEKYYSYFIETADSFFECSVKDCFIDRKIPAELEHCMLNKILCPCDGDVYRFPSWKEFDSLDEFKPYRDMEEHGDMTVFRPEFVCSPRTLFTALWRAYLRKDRRLSEKAAINLRFYFRKNNLMMKIESVEE